MSNGEEAAIRKVIEAYGDLLRASDVSGVVDLYTVDAAIMQPEQETAVGTQQIAAVYQTGLDAVGMDFAFQFDDIVAHGDVAAVRTRSTGTVTVRASGEAMPAKFRELFVLERVNGDWRIAQYMFQPMPQT